MSNAFEKLLRGDFPEKFEFVELLDHYRDYFDAVKTSARRITDKIFGKKIVFIAGFVTQIKMRKDTAFLPIRFLSLQMKDILSDSEHLFYREGKTLILPREGLHI